MKWLLWKEYRLNRVIVGMLLLFLIAPPTVGFYIHWRYAEMGTRWQQCMAVSNYFSIFMSQIVLAFIGGNVIACERVDRSAEFQVYLPLTRRKILSAKLLLALAMFAAIWLIHPPILWGLMKAEGIFDSAEKAKMYSEVLCNTGATGLTFFCVAWLFSSFLTSPIYSVCAGLLTPLLVVGCLGCVQYYSGISPDKFAAEILEPWYSGICFTLSPLCFAAGTWLYLRRVEP